MGKERSTKSLSRIIGNIAIHKALVQHTKKPESKNFLEKEIIEYRDAIIKKSVSYNWNQEDKAKIRKEALKYAKNRKENKYSDANISVDELEHEIEEITKEMGLDF